MHLSILSDTQIQALKKKYFLTSEVHLCICAYFQTTRIKFLNRIFLTSGVVKNVFWCNCAYFQTTRNMGSKMMLFNVWSGNIRILMHLRILPDHLKNYFLMCEVHLCLCAYFQTTRIKFLKKIFLTSGVAKNVFSYFLFSKKVENVFLCWSG